MKGRQEDAKRNAAIMAMLKAGQTWSQITEHMDCSRATITKLAKRLHSAESAATT
jgi:uncharacterized protein YerC